jgi:hypothetical protein
MKSNTDERPGDNQGHSRQECTDDTGKHPKVGLPGKLQAAQSSAPASATDERIQRVAFEAYERDIHPETLWGEL